VVHVILRKKATRERNPLLGKKHWPLLQNAASPCREKNICLIPTREKIGRPAKGKGAATGKKRHPPPLVVVNLPSWVALGGGEENIFENISKGPICPERKGRKKQK